MSKKTQKKSARDGSGIALNELVRIFERIATAEENAAGTSARVLKIMERVHRDRELEKWIAEAAPAMEEAFCELIGRGVLIDGCRAIMETCPVAFQRRVDGGGWVYPNTAVTHDRPQGGS